MKVIHKTQKWKEYFTYLDGYDEEEYYRSVEFMMEIVLSENSFTGVSWDEYSKAYFNSTASVRGFF
jgi:hypothetical protein